MNKKLLPNTTPSRLRKGIILDSKQVKLQLINNLSLSKHSVNSNWV